MSTQLDPSDHEGRLSKVEALLASVADLVEKLGIRMDAMWSNVHTHMQSAGRPNYTALGVLAAVVFGIGGIVHQTVRDDARETKDRVRVLEEADRSHLYQRGRTDEKLAALEKSVEDLTARTEQRFKDFDTGLQREMRDLDAAIIGQIQGMRTQIVENIHTELAAINVRMERVVQYQDRAREMNADQLARIRALEEQRQSP